MKLVTQLIVEVHRAQEEILKLINNYSYIGRVRVNPANSHHFTVDLSFKEAQLIYHEAPVDITLLYGYDECVDQQGIPFVYFSTCKDPAGFYRFISVAST